MEKWWVASIIVLVAIFAETLNMKEKIILEYRKLESINKKFVILTIALLTYGYLCRILNLFFFWESKTLGWILLFVSAILILNQRIKENKIKGKWNRGQKYAQKQS